MRRLKCGEPQPLLMPVCMGWTTQSWMNSWQVRAGKREGRQRQAAGSKEKEGRRDGGRAGGREGRRAGGWEGGREGGQDRWRHGREVHVEGMDGTTIRTESEGTGVDGLWRSRQAGRQAGREGVKEDGSRGRVRAGLRVEGQ